MMHFFFWKWIYNQIHMLFSWLATHFKFSIAHIFSFLLPALVDQHCSKDKSRFLFLPSHLKLHLYQEFHMLFHLNLQWLPSILVLAFYGFLLCSWWSPLLPQQDLTSPSRRALSSSICTFLECCRAAICTINSCMFLAILSCKFLANCSKVRVGWEEPRISLTNQSWFPPPQFPRHCFCGLLRVFSQAIITF